MNEIYFHNLEGKKLRRIFLSAVTFFEQDHGLDGVSDIDGLESATETCALFHSLGATFVSSNTLVFCMMKYAMMDGKTYLEAGMRAYLLSKFLECRHAFLGKRDASRTGPFRFPTDD